MTKYLKEQAEVVSSDMGFSSLQEAIRVLLTKLSKIKKAFHRRLELFIQDPRQSLLRDHPLAGKLQGYRAFSITGDIRVVYYIFEDTAYFVDIGTHNQVYGK